MGDVWSAKALGFSVAVHRDLVYLIVTLNLCPEEEQIMGCTPVDVEIEVITPDQKRKIIFGLVKLCNDDQSVTWKINFELDEKKNSTDTSFNEVAKVTVRIGEDDHAAAQVTADQKKLSDAQAAQAIAAGDTLKTHKDNPDHPDVQADVTQVLHADES
jgi:hypothetical protein